MSNLVLKENQKIEDMIYEMMSKQVMLDKEIFTIKYNYYLYDKISD